ncbi:CD209 antigen-like [Poecilia reticulata]|uniref:CD209 antigen-like n=1 Tax=Poecilia reticulata TaxID=8081 RepID=A0A3P9MWD2_POERE|nr:PREDICTED: CD209 antigen-like [Poecilia reticulata]XP_008406073.1 PREDICTED: CD209 antigen-like [Poecilia reticulata]
MSVEYRASNAADTDMTRSEIAYKSFSSDGKNFLLSVYSLRSQSFKLATIGLGLLCVVLVAWLIGQSVHNQKVKKDNLDTLKALNENKEQLQANLKTVQIAKKELESNLKQQQGQINFISRQIDVLASNNRELTKERNDFKAKQREADTNKIALNNELGLLRDSTARLQKEKDALSAAQTSLNTRCDAIAKRSKELQANYDTVTNERNNLQNKFNNVSRSRDRLQVSYSDMINKMEELHDKYNFSLSEKDKLSSVHLNLTTEIKVLEDINSVLRKAENDLQSSYRSVQREKSELQSSLKNVTADRDLLRAKVDNLTAEQDELLGRIDKLNATLQEKRCPAGWRKFQYSCYFPSTTKKTWTLSREDCHSKGADLAIVTSKDEMNFINSLYNDKEVWIGLSDGGVEGQWKWVDGTPLTLTFWAQGQPNSHQGRNQDCVEVWHRSKGDGDWNDENCNVEQFWICEK